MTETQQQTTDPILKNKQSFDSEVEGIRSHPDLSEEAKGRYLSGAYERAKSKHDALVTEHQERLDKTVAQTEKAVFEVPMPLASTTAEKIAAQSSYRDAAFRVDEVLDRTDVQERGRVLEGLLERAERRGDTYLATAIYHASAERGLWNVGDRYRAAHPTAAKKWEEYTAAREERESLANRMFGWAPPRKPHEIERPGMRYAGRGA